MGGTRITTFMFYLSDVQLGGKTIFPQAGIGIQPGIVPIPFGLTF